MSRQLSAQHSPTKINLQNFESLKFRAPYAPADLALNPKKDNHCFLQSRLNRLSALCSEDHLRSSRLDRFEPSSDATLSDRPTSRTSLKKEPKTEKTTLNALEPSSDPTLSEKPTRQSILKKKQKIRGETLDKLLKELEIDLLDCSEEDVEEKNSQESRLTSPSKNQGLEYTTFLEEKLRELEAEKWQSRAWRMSPEEKYKREIESLRAKCQRLEEKYAKSQKELNEHVQEYLKQAKMMHNHVEKTFQCKDNSVNFYKSEAERNKMWAEMYKKRLEEVMKKKNTAKPLQKRVKSLRVEA